MLIGQYEHTIDSKKRLSLPSKFRKELGKKVVITRGTDNCLVVYTEDKWKLEAEKLSGLPISQREAREYARITLAGATEIELDKLGRVLIPDYLKSYSGLIKNVIVIGLSDRLEIWDNRKWEIYRTRVEKKVNTIASKLGDLGI